MRPLHARAAARRPRAARARLARARRRGARRLGRSRDPPRAVAHAGACAMVPRRRLLPCGAGRARRPVGARMVRRVRGHAVEPQQHAACTRRRVGSARVVRARCGGDRGRAVRRGHADHGELRAGDRVAPLPRRARAVRRRHRARGRARALRVAARRARARRRRRAALRLERRRRRDRRRGARVRVVVRRGAGNPRRQGLLRASVLGWWTLSAAVHPGQIASDE